MSEEQSTEQHCWLCEAPLTPATTRTIIVKVNFQIGGKTEATLRNPICPICTAKAEAAGLSASIV